jgi:hypothetical protein
VHGAGAQRSDPKMGEPRLGHGPQGDAQRVKNFVRWVRGGVVTLRETTVKQEPDPARYPNTIRVAGKARKPEPLSSAKPPGAPVMAGAPPMGGAGMGGMTSGGKPPAGAAFIQRLDRNGDGAVSRSEFDGPRDHFRMWDKNKDGGITADEAPTGPPPPGGPGGGPGRPLR